MTSSKQTMTLVQALTLAILALDFEAEDAQQRQVTTWMHEMREAADVLRKMRDVIQERLRSQSE